MPDVSTPSLGRRLFAGASQVFIKFQSFPPLVTLPAVGLVAWLATPYVVTMAQGHGVEVAQAGEPGDSGDTTSTARSDPVAHVPASEPNTAVSPAGTAAATSILARPITASTIPTWLPLPAPAPASTSPVSQPASPRQTVQRPAAPAPRPPKAIARLVAPLPQQQQRVAQRQSGGGYQRRPAESLMQSFNHALQTGRSAAIGRGFVVPRGPVGGAPPSHMGGGGGYVLRGSFGGAGYRSSGGGNFGGMRGGGGYGGGRGGGRR